jgi:threonine synthase
MWRYRALLPVPSSEAAVTLGEGGTPLLLLPDVTRRTGAAEVWLKYEAINPTGSFKDRANAVTISMAVHFGYDKIACASTGNHGVSVAAYAARAGLRSLVLLPPEASPIAVREIQCYGGEAVRVRTGRVTDLLGILWRDYGWFISQRNAPGTGGRPIGNPFGVEGYKTIAYEIFEQLGHRVPDMVFVPVGGGDSIWGVYKGFEELARLGMSGRVPAMIACQSSAGAPLEHAWRLNLPRVEAVEVGPTIAASIVDAQSGDHALLAIRRSGGRAVAVEDHALERAGASLQRSGICVEPSSAAALAGLEALVAMGETLTGLTVVLLGTGTGFRWPASMASQPKQVPVIDATVDALSRVVLL